MDEQERRQRVERMMQGTQVVRTGKIIDLKSLPAWQACKIVNAVSKVAQSLQQPMQKAFENMARYLLQEKLAYMRKGYLVPKIGKRRQEKLDNREEVC